MPNANQAGLPATVSRRGKQPEFRLRGGSVIAGEVLAVDISALDPLTKSTAGEERDLGSQTAASGNLATVRKVTGAPSQEVTLAVATSPVADNQLGRFECGDDSSEPREIEALVVVASDATVGKVLGVTASGGYGAFSASGTGGYARLMEDATSSDGKGPSSTVNRKRVLFYPAGIPVSGGPVTREDLANPGGLTSVRLAAYGGGGASTQDNWASASWEGTTNDFELVVTLASTDVPTDTQVLGATVAGYPSLLIKGDGTIQLRNNATVELASPAGAFAEDGSEQTIRGVFGESSGSIYVDGRLVAQGAWASGDITWFGSGAQPMRIGARITANQRWYGTIRDVKLTDNNDASNSALYKLDEVTGDYVDSLGNLADATRNGYVDSVEVQSVEGNAKPVHAQPLVVAGWERDDTSESLDGSVASAHILTSTDRSDPFGLLSDSTATAPFDGYVIVHGTVGVTGSDGTDEFSVWAQKNSSNETKMLVWTPGTSFDQRPANAMFAVNKGDTVRITAASIAAGNTGLQHRNSNVTYSFLRSN